MAGGGSRRSGEYPVIGVNSDDYYWLILVAGMRSAKVVVNAFNVDFQLIPHRVYLAPFESKGSHDQVQEGLFAEWPAVTRGGWCHRVVAIVFVGVGVVGAACVDYAGSVW